MLRKVFLLIVVSSAVLLVLATLLSLIRDIPYWYIKVLDFPRQQLLIGLLVCLLFFAWLNRRWTVKTMLLTVLLVIAIGIQGYYIIPYTFMYPKAVPAASVAAQTNGTDTLSLLVANVWMDNRNAAAFLAMVERLQPDMVLTLETDAWWIKQLQVLKERYPYTMEHPLENTYGMGLYSRYPLRNVETLFLHHDKVPAFRADVAIGDNQLVSFYGLHPVPPKPSAYPDNIGEEELALLKIGKMVAQHKGPVVVAGDFNDVAWSHTSRLFGVKGELLDIRIGRGLYNTFDATSFFMRWPIDHVYVSKEFAVDEFERMGPFGSDHFALYTRLILQQQP